MIKCVEEQETLSPNQPTNQTAKIKDNNGNSLSKVQFNLKTKQRKYQEQKTIKSFKHTNGQALENSQDMLFQNCPDLNRFKRLKKEEVIFGKKK